MTKKMVCEQDCRFCKIIEGNYKLGKIDTPILENDKFIAILSVGGFIEGWTLIVPKAHVYSMKEIYKTHEFKSFMSQTLGMLQKIYGKNFIIFEHGANHEDSIVACGTNHAHVHIVPYKKSLIDLMNSDGKEWNKCNVNDLDKLVGDEEYWFYAENILNGEDVNGFVHVIKEKESQYFRRLLGEQEGYEKSFDYKEHMYVDVVNRAFDRIKG